MEAATGCRHAQDGTALGAKTLITIPTGTRAREKRVHFAVRSPRKITASLCC